MAISVFPAPTAGDNWVQIATATPTTAVASVSFTSIPTNYRELWLVTTGQIDPSVSATMSVTINSITGANDYRHWKDSTGDADAGIFHTVDTDNGSVNLYFYNPTTNNLPFVTFEGGMMSGTNKGRQFIHGYLAAATTNITTIDITLASGDFSTNTGTFVLYGTV